MDKWFANKGQVVQVVCAVIAATISLMVWLAIPASSLLYYLALLAVMICLGSLVWMVSAAYTTEHLERTTRSSLIPTSPTSPMPSPPILSSPLDKLLPIAPIVLTNVACNIGGFWERNISGKDIRIIVHSIKKVREQDNYRADIEIRGAGSLHGGNDTQSISSARYWVNRTSTPFGSEPSMLFSIEIHPYGVTIFTLRVDHIDPKSNRVNLELCVVRGQPEVLDAKSG